MYTEEYFNVKSLLTYTMTIKFLNLTKYLMFNFLKIELEFISRHLGAGEITQWLRALVALTDNSDR